MTYDGGKGQAGVYQKIINQIPPHCLYVEAFAGGASVLRLKRPASSSIAIEADGRAAAALRSLALPACVVVNGDALSLLPTLSLDAQSFVYVDPPYLMSTRSNQLSLYPVEFSTEDEHARLLTLLCSLPCMVAISGYASSLYAAMLANWRVISYQAVKRSGEVVMEYLWMNYPAPVRLHDYRYLGEDFRERERIKKKKARWVARLGRLSLLEQRALLDAIDEVYSSASSDVVVATSSSSQVAMLDARLPASSEMAMCDHIAVSADSGSQTS